MNILYSQYKKSLHFFSVRLPEETIEKFKIAVYVTGKKQQKIVDELFLQFYEKIILTNQNK